MEVKFWRKLIEEIRIPDGPAVERPRWYYYVTGELVGNIYPEIVGDIEKTNEGWTVSVDPPRHWYWFAGASHGTCKTQRRAMEIVELISRDEITS